MRQFKWGAGLLLATACGSTSALDFEAWGANVVLKSAISTGAAWRMQDINYDLVGKLNVPGQTTICEPDNCLSLNLDPGPNQRLVDARGSYFGSNADNGNLNYQKHDVVAATTKLVTDMTITHGDFLARIRGMGYYDPVNSDFDERHPNTVYQPAKTPRNGEVIDRYALGVDLLDAYVQYAFTWGERQGTISVGNQIVRWGESTLVQLNSLAEINPPNAAVLRMPGAEVNEVFQPIPLAVLSTDLFEGVSIELIYQLAWRAVKADPAGSFFADTDLIAGGEYAMVSLGQFSEDPDREFVAADVLGYLTSTTLTIYPEETEASDDGQYGARLNYFADWLNGGTELGFYFFNYHSRLPYATVQAAQESCARDSGNLAEAYLDCNGFNGGRQQLPQLNPFAPRGEPLPADTIKAFLVYPEDIRMVGVSFNTNIGNWSLAGEYSYRDNLPLQVHIPDVIFAGLQPAFPANQIDADPTGLGAAATLFGLANDLGVPVETFAALLGFPGGDRLLSATFPAARVAVPSYLVEYRNLGRVAPGQMIAGFERLKVGQVDFTAIRAVSNTLGADQIIGIFEVGMTQVYNMPDRERLQFEGNYVNNTSYAPGADGTGQPGGQPDPRTLVPTQQRKGFADDLSWGVRVITRFEYNDVVFGWSFKPTVGFVWDIEGVAPFPMQNFVEGRKEILAGTDINFTQDLSGRVLYQWFTGAGDLNTRRDRDNLAISLSYAF